MNTTSQNTLIINALRCWQAFRFGASQEATLQKVNHSIITAHRKSTVAPRLYLLAIFIAIETGHYDSANEMLDKAMGYKSFLRNDSPLFYGVLCFLYAELEINQKRARSAKKYRAALASHISHAPYSPYYNVMLGLLHLSADEPEEAYSLLSAALNEGVRSVFLYEGLFRYYVKFHGKGEKLLPVLIYAAEHGADIGEIAARYADELSAAIKAEPSAGERLYELTGYPPLLKAICTIRIENNDLSPEAFALYRAAEKKQMYTAGLFNALVSAAYKNKARQVSPYTIRRFLDDTDSFSDLGLAVYVCHFLLSEPALAELVPDLQTKILQLGTHCLDNDIRGREANSVYYYLWRCFREMEITGAALDKAEEILRESLTLFELETPENVKFVYITEPEKRGMKVYETPEPVTVVGAVSANARLVCLGAGGRTVLYEQVTLTPMIGGASAELYLHFYEGALPLFSDCSVVGMSPRSLDSPRAYDNRERGFNLLAYLANYFLEAEQANEYENEYAVPVFEALLKEKTISKPYRMRIIAALGKLHYEAKNYDKALEFYGEVDENAIGVGSDFVEQIINVYLQTGEYARAVGLISDRYMGVSREFLFGAVGVLLGEGLDSQELAQAGYYLLVNDFFCEKILDFVLENFDGSYSEWAALSQILDEENRAAPSLDEKVLRAALAMASFDEHAQRAFIRIYSANGARASEDKNEAKADIIGEFIELATFEMFANQTRPSYDVLNILERAADGEGEDIVLIWGLASVYLRYNITTFKSDEIIKRAIAAMENEGLLFPIFKAVQTPFIEKFQPFVYFSDKRGNAPKLYYKADGGTYTSLPMQYVRYGMYAAIVPMFYNEQLTYYFCEESATGSVATQEYTVTNAKPFLYEGGTESDEYFTINNAIIYEQMFKHERVEGLIGELVKGVQSVRGRLV